MTCTANRGDLTSLSSLKRSLSLSSNAVRSKRLAAPELLQRKQRKKKRIHPLPSRPAPSSPSLLWHLSCSADTHMHTSPSVPCSPQPGSPARRTGISSTTRRRSSDSLQRRQRRRETERSTAAGRKGEWSGPWRGGRTCVGRVARSPTGRQP